MTGEKSGDGIGTAHALARIALEANGAAFAPGIMHQAQLLLLDTIGCGIAGAREEVARAVADREPRLDARLGEARALRVAPHHRRAAGVAAETARQTFEEGTIAENLPTVEVSRSELEAGIGVLASFVKAGLVASNGEARRQIKGGGLRVNDAAVGDERMLLTPANLTPEGVVKLSLGKKRHVLLKPA